MNATERQESAESLRSKIESLRKERDDLVQNQRVADNAYWNADAEHSYCLAMLIELEHPDIAELKSVATKSLEAHHAARKKAQELIDERGVTKPYGYLSF